MRNSTSNDNQGVVIEKDLPLGSVEESNLFLRALWGILRSKYGKLGWQYTPKKSGEERRISFGYMSLAGTSSGPIEVSIEYERRGVIRNICFQTLHGKTPSEGLARNLRKSVIEAVESKGNPIRKMLGVNVASSLNSPLAPYCGQNWMSIPVNENVTRISIDIAGFDEADLTQEFLSRLDELLDALSFMTNVSFFVCEGVSSDNEQKVEAVNAYLSEEGWLDDFSIEAGQLRLSRSQVEYCDRLVNRNISDGKSIKAARLFRSGLEVYQQTGLESNIAATLFVSAVEAISLPLEKNKSCDTCGQPVFSISQRVSEVADRHLGPHVARMFRSRYYNDRSKYLHTGHVRATQPMQRNIIPLLDPNGFEGCAAPALMTFPKNLMEFTSFILRREIENIPDE